MQNELDMKKARTPKLRKPNAEDGAAIWRLIRDCKPLDENSLYANLIQADHFRDTCVVAEMDGDIVGWISGHMIPAQDAFFVWQVAVSPKARGLGLGKTMLMELVNSDETEDAKTLKQTITRDKDHTGGRVPRLAKHVRHEPPDAPLYNHTAQCR